MVDYFKDVHKTGMERVLAEAEHRRQEYEERVSVSGPIAARIPKSAEETIATFIYFSVFGGIWYYGITELTLEWYWAVGLGFVAGIAAHKVLMGPLYFVLILAKWLIIVGMVGGLIYLFFGR